MMTFTVVAVDTVEAALAEIWTEAHDRQAVTDAANWLDGELKVDPLTKVTPVDNLFFLRRDPLVVLCRISVEDRMVTILEVHCVEDQ
jgi:hypothetical protein